MAQDSVRILGLDVGEKRIGVAVAYPDGIVVRPLVAINRSSISDDTDKIVSLINEYNIELVVVGLPISLDGKFSHQARLVKDFTRNLTDASPVRVKSHDERFSTVEANRLLIDAGQKPSRNKGLLDSASAAVILQSYLESNRFRS
ncbi:MAG: Holliday junction resolvase RuvX [SAR202 cluster bacterium]|nr:Holliday junction resolvase RuvX [SAR202 cluster bacterium]|tara:strand:+ start:1420 stop:1854 length:435 start_codon:yes stop_codon:yes gene_type:complete